MTFGASIVRLEEEEKSIERIKEVPIEIREKTIQNETNHGKQSTQIKNWGWLFLDLAKNSTSWRDIWN